MSDQTPQPAPAVALIIPSLDGHVEPLLASVRRQTLQPVEVAVVRGVRPNGRARNRGVAQTRVPVLVFVDDDAVLGNEQVIHNLVAPLLVDPTIGVTGAAKLLPPGAPWFQRWAAREVPRIVHPDVASPLETNPDPPAFYSEITTTCCAMRREVFERAGGFDETLVRGVDTEFFVRVRRLRSEERGARSEGRRGEGRGGEGRGGDPRDRPDCRGAWEQRSEDRGSDIPVAAFRLPIQTAYRFVLVPHTWTYHPAPATLPALLRKQFLYGYGHAQEVQRDPSRARGRRLPTRWHAIAYLLFRTAILLPNIFLPYSFAAPSWRPGFKPLKALASYASALGYIWGWYNR
jgi:hypothetical protein